MSADLDAVAASLVRHEGFRGSPYKDHLGFPTIGYGAKLPLDRAEGYWLLRHRMESKAAALTREIPWWQDLPTPAANALLEMTYQMGTSGLLRFRNTLAHLKEGRYAEAAIEALDSRWAQQTPERAAEVAAMIRSAE